MVKEAFSQALFLLTITGAQIIIPSNAVAYDRQKSPFKQRSAKLYGSYNDYIFEEIEDTSIIHNSSKRASWDFYAMIKCGTGCNPLVYKGYGCYCGFLGSGPTVDDLDRCCFKHDWCYSTTSCKFLAYNLPYFVPYKWKCNAGSPKCYHKNRGRRSCSEELCECDRMFVDCLSKFPCPTKKAMCTSPWRYYQNLFMDLGVAMSMDSDHSYNHIAGSSDSVYH